jgi:predicted O-methyltransferase YrrM
MNLRLRNLGKLFDAEWLGEKLFQLHLRRVTDPPQSGSIEGYLHPIEERCVQWAAAQAPRGGTIVEVGSYHGKSAVNFAHAVRKAGNGAKVYCVDTWRNENIVQAAGEDVFHHFTANTSPYGDVIVPLRGRSEEVGAAWDKGPVDVLFIDGDHTFEGVTRDIEAWAPHLRRGGLALFHDTDIEGVDRGLRQSMHHLNPTRRRKAWSIRLYWKG